jgi:hypothetical protein
MNYQLDAFAKRIHFLQHILPIWQAAPRQGFFFVTPELYRDYAALTGDASFLTVVYPNERGHYQFPETGNPIITSAYRDFTDVLSWERFSHETRRIKIFMEHGAGFTFANGNPSYAGGGEERKNVDLFLSTNRYVKWANERAQKTPNAIIGCPKLDKWHKQASQRQALQGMAEPVIGVAFHWDCKIAPETRSAYPVFKSAIHKLAQQYTVIGHAHPRETALMRAEFAKMGIEFVDDFEQIMARCDIYLNDASSTLYEFASLDKPVVVLNAPWYRHRMKFGLRFWEHSDVGVNCDNSEKLPDAVELALQDSPEQQAKRQAATQDVYPVRGNAAETANQAIETFMKERPYSAPTRQRFDQVNGKSVGIIYMAFGEKAARGVEQSVFSLRKLRIDIPVTVVGTSPARGCDFIEWKGQSPFDPLQRQNFQFRAGRVKPFLYDVTPYDFTLYIDADTEYMRDFRAGFAFLEEADIAIAEEKNPISALYNKPLAGWEVNISERDYTLEAIGHDELFLNSGVLFFRKSEACAQLMKNWQTEWPRFAQWDEQLALTRAIYQTSNLIVKRLSIDWNHPHRGQSKSQYIFHNYGRGNVRSNVS